MSIESLQNDLRHNVAAISQRIYKMRCRLAHETDRDKLILGTREISRLEGLQEGFKVAMSEIKKHIGADTNVPMLANWSKPSSPKEKEGDEEDLEGV